MVLLLPGEAGRVVASLEVCFAFGGQRSVRICRDNSSGRRERISNGVYYASVYTTLSMRTRIYEPILVTVLISMKHASSSISSPSSPSNGGSSE